MNWAWCWTCLEDSLVFCCQVLFWLTLGFFMVGGFYQANVMNKDWKVVKVVDQVVDEVSSV